MGVTGLEVDVFRDESCFVDLKPEWEELEERARLQLPFQTWAWNAAWWPAFREDRFAVRDELELRTFRDASGRLRGVAPMVLTSRPGRGSFRSRQLQFFGADPNVTEIRGAVCGRDDEEAVARALVDDVRAHAREWDWMLWHGVRLDSSAVPVIAHAGAVRWTSDLEDLTIVLPKTWDLLKSNLSRNMKEALRKCANSLKREGLSAELVVARTWREIEPQLEQFFMFHAARASVDTGVRHRNVFDAPPSRAFLRDAIRRFCDRDRTRLFMVQVGGEVVAMRIGFVVGGALYLYYSGYELAFGKYSIMTTCVAEAIRWAIDEQLEVVNLSTGIDASKARWSPETTSYRCGLLHSPTFRGPLMHWAFAHGEDRLRSGAFANTAKRLLGRRAGRRD
jgi:CelD/BcsL family acetyltransferase involved in cellulose biosynthesis